MPEEYAKNGPSPEAPKEPIASDKPVEPILPEYKEGDTILYPDENGKMHNWTIFFDGDDIILKRIHLLKNVELRVPREQLDNPYKADAPLGDNETPTHNKEDKKETVIEKSNNLKTSLLGKELNNYHGSDNLNAESSLAGGAEKFKDALSAPNAGREFAEKIVKGLESKGQLGDMKPVEENRLILELFAKLKHDGFVASNGSIIEGRQDDFVSSFNPYEQAHEALNEMHSGGTFIAPAEQSREVFVHEKNTPLPEKSPSVSDQSPTPISSSGSEKPIIDTLLPSTDRASFEIANKLSSQQIKEMFASGKSYVSKEVGDALERMLKENKIQNNNIRLDPSGDKLVIDLGNGYRIHDLENHFQPESARPWYDPFGFFSSKAENIQIDAPKPPLDGSSALSPVRHNQINSPNENDLKIEVSQEGQTTSTSSDEQTITVEIPKAPDNPKP